MAASDADTQLMRVPLGTCVVVNALTVSGGIKEAIGLCRSLTSVADASCLVTMWGSRNAVATDGLKLVALSRWIANRSWAAFQLPWLMLRFYCLTCTRLDENTRYVFTHYSTYALAWLAPSAHRYFLVQGVEWNFPKNPWVQRLLRAVIVTTLRRGHVVAVNDYIAEQLQAAGIRVHHAYPVWADRSFLRCEVRERTVDVVMVLRHGRVKRLDLYRNFIARVREQRPDWQLAVISPEADLCDELTGVVSLVLQNPTVDEMAELYADSKVFLMLSEQEGFGLPPLEAMAAGCVPICRDCGGVRAYMTGAWSSRLLPLDADRETIFSAVDKCLKRADLKLLSEEARAAYLRGWTESSSLRQKAVEWLAGHDRESQA